MRKFVAILGLFIAASLCAQSASLYTQTNKWVIGGEGGWDYLLVDSQSNRLFVAHGMKIEVLDLSNGKVVGSMPANGSHGVALIPDQNLGFFTNGRAGTVSVFDYKGLKVSDEIKAGENPDAIIYDSHSKKILVMNGRSKDLSVIDPSSKKVIATVPLGGKLEFAATDGAHAYINVEDTGEIAVVDSKTWKPGARYKLDGCEEPSGLAIDEKTEHLFAVCGNKKMFVVDAKTGKIITTLDTGAGTDAAAFDAGLKRAFASNGQGTLTVVEQQGQNYKVAGNVDTARGARTMALNPNTHKIYTATAEFGPPAEGQKRPSITPGSFMVLEYSPTK